MSLLVLSSHIKLFACGTALFIGGLALAVVPGYLLLPSIGPCHDFIVQHHVLARLSIGPKLPFPVVELCSNATNLFALFYAGYVIAAAGTVLLLFARLSLFTIGAITIAALALAIAMPFVPTTDPYAYALYAYVPFVLKQSPYFAQHMNAVSPIAATLSLILPEANNPIRIFNYGPVYALINELLIGPFGLISLKAMLIAERVAGATCLIALGLLISMTQQEVIKKRQSFIAITLNPLLLFQSVSFAHGDIYMLLLLAAAYVLYLKRRFSGAACFCVFAAETRFTAALAIIVLFSVLLQGKHFAHVGRVALVAAATIAVTWIWSECAYDVFRLNGFSFFFSNYDAPITIAITLIFGTTATALMLGAFLQAGLGGIVAYVSLRERLYSLMPAAALMTLPVFEPWYAQWLAPIAILTSNIAYRGATIVFMLLAPLTIFTVMVPLQNFYETRAAIVALQWVAPIFVYCCLNALLRRTSEQAPVLVLQ